MHAAEHILEMHWAALWQNALHGFRAFTRTLPMALDQPGAMPQPQASELSLRTRTAEGHRARLAMRFQLAGLLCCWAVAYGNELQLR
jgi:hypothetical protein